MSSQITVCTSTRIFVRNCRVNMVAAVWSGVLIPLTTRFGWLFVPLRQYFRLYRTVSQKGRKKRKKIDERKNVQTTFTRTFCKRYRPFFLLLSKPGRVARSVGHLTCNSGVLGLIPGLATYFRFSFRFFKKGSCQLLAKVCARSTG